MKGWSPVLVVLAALFWGISGGIGAILMTRGWDAISVSFYRGMIGFIFLLTWLVLRPSNSGLASCRTWFWSVFAGLGVAGNFTFYFLSISEGSVAVAATLMYCAPVFVYLVSFALRLESFNVVKAAAIVLVLLGVVLLTGLYDIDTSAVTLIGFASGLLAGVCYAVFIFSFKYAAIYGSPQSVLVIAFATLITVLLSLGDQSQMVAVLSAPDSWPLFATLGVLGAGLSFTLYLFGLKHTAPTTASVVAMVEPVTASLFGIVVLNEHLEGLQISGIALILITVTALSVYSSYQSEE